MCLQNEFYASLTQQTGNHGGGVWIRQCCQNHTPYIKCLLLNLNTCAFLQLFYKMRCVFRMSFMRLWPSKLEIMGGGMNSAVLPKSYPPILNAYYWILTLVLFCRYSIRWDVSSEWVLCISDPANFISWGGGMNSAVLPKYAVKYDVSYVNYILFCCMKYTCAYIHVHTLSLYFIVLCNRLSVLLFLFLCTGKLFLLQQIIF